MKRPSQNWSADYGAGGGNFIGVSVGVAVGEGVGDRSGTAKTDFVSANGSETTSLGTVCGEDIGDAWNDVAGRDAGSGAVVSGEMEVLRSTYVAMPTAALAAVPIAAIKPITVAQN